MVLTCTHNLCFEKKYENFPFLVVKFSIYLNRRVFIMLDETLYDVASDLGLHYLLRLVCLNT